MLRKIRINNYNIIIFIYFANIKYKLVITSYSLKKRILLTNGTENNATIL